MGLLKRIWLFFFPVQYVTGKDFKVTIDVIPLEKFKGEVSYSTEPIEVLGRFEVSEIEPKITVKHK